MKHRSRWLLPLALLCFTLLSRAQTFGNPFLETDEQFYLFSGGQLLEGHFPYIDIWDRKPFGLFLLYAFFHLFGPWRVLAYQTGAALAVWCTALLIFRTARTVAPRSGALLSSLLYITWLNLSGGEGGQSPVFYNLLVTAAVALVLFRIVLRKENGKSLFHTGCLATFLFGIALQIKYTALFEGLAIGLFLSWTTFRKTRDTAKIFRYSTAWIICALLPTALVATGYALSGHGYDWYFANIRSIFLRTPPPAASGSHELRKILFILIPFLIAPITTASTFFRRPASSALNFLTLWAASACAGVLVFGLRYTHYLLPLFPPLAVLSAPVWNFSAGRRWLPALLTGGIITSQLHLHHSALRHGSARTYNTILEKLSDTHGCLFLYEGPPALYDSPHWCRLTTHPFPAHFNEAPENSATGMNPAEETLAILKKHPEYIGIQEPEAPGENLSVRTEVISALHHGCTLIYTFRRKEEMFEIFRCPTSPLTRP